MIKNFKWLLLVSLAFAACNSDDDDQPVVQVPVTAGEANFSKYVALGNSLCAGYMDGALYIKGQENSWTKILSDQFKLAGGGEFRIPYMNDNYGALLLAGNVISENRLYFRQTDDDGNPVTPSPTRLPLAQYPPTNEIGVPLTGPFNNMGVPGAKVFHLLKAGYGNVAGVPGGLANPYFARFASSPTASILGDAVAQNATFFSLWIGNNDILSYATSGGIGVNQTGNFDPATYGSNDITDPQVFAGAYSEIVNQMTAGGAKGVVANIPDVTTIPYFTSVPYNPVPLDAAKAGALNAGFATYNGGLNLALGAGLITADEKARRTVQFVEGKNPVVIVDSYLTNLSALGLPSYRMATAEDLIVLPASAFIGTLVGGNASAINGVTVPLTDQWVLSKNEIAEVQTATAAYNATISGIAASKGLAFVDARQLMIDLNEGGIVSNGFTLTSALVFGTAFSLDGVHPTARGYALIANEFSKAINDTYNSTLPMVDISKYNPMWPKDLPQH
jgi:hypothetical protein